MAVRAAEELARQRAVNGTLKVALLFIAALTLIALGEALGVPPLSMPGYIVVRTATQLPDPYPIRDAHAPHRAAISVVSDVVWLSVLGAWYVIGQQRSRSAN